MKTNYNPFNKKELIETEHGIINFQHDIGTCYVTHRRPEHVFKKFQAFAISLSELEIAYDNNVYWILIMYTNAKQECTPYRIKLKETRFLQQYDYNGDKQVIIPIKHMEANGKEGWQ